ncbi:putative N-acetyltransferase YhbS [Streptomyces sp. BK022]|uniref:GNAT family N-acetyltransferase n=1 Tax=Streptomyces sp. BK022 TaxID=2512123 RepID=UPI00102A6956|nr:GNAT family N-acetyltransferase [Streptomyces sp. BK022]RZU44184.1 putative N-acetyltransferase YhbS [Streptomyces sp. BK022]
MAQSAAPLTVRRAQAADSGQLAEIARGAYGKYLDVVDEPPAPILLDYDRVAAAGRTHVAHVADRILGMVTVEPDGPWLILRNLAVRPDLQGQGIGKRLVTLVEDMARSSGRDGVRLWTRAEMTDNVAFYRALGYVLTHSEKNEHAHRVFFRKELGGDTAGARASLDRNALEGQK